MNPSDYNIPDLIPQRPPMQMIDLLIYADERTARGKLSVKETNLFIKEGKLSESALIEFIAQTAAAYTGYNNMIKNNTVTEGYIGAVKNLEVTELPVTGDELFCDIEVVNEIIGFTIVNGSVKLNDRTIASCEMRILSAPASA